MPTNTIDLKKLQMVLEDAAKIGAKEIKRGIQSAKLNLNKYHLLQKRKDLLADLGRNFFDSFKAGGSTYPLSEGFFETLIRDDFTEILKELEQLDHDLETVRKNK